MQKLVTTYRHRTGEHCASTALRNILAHDGMELSEGMIFGLASGLGFIYLRAPEASPSRMFHGRTWDLEQDFGRNTGIRFEDRPVADDDQAWETVRAKIDAGQPVMVSTDTFYLDYHRTSSHFPGHRCVVVGYDDDAQTVFIADRKFDAYMECSYTELRHSRNAPDYPISCENRYGDFDGPIRLGRPMGAAIRSALRLMADHMLTPEAEVPSGIPAMRELAEDFPRWVDAPDWSWASRFGYQVVEKRGAAGTFFRSLIADFLREAHEYAPELDGFELAARMDAIAGRWQDLAAVLKDQSEREVCEPRLFAEAAALTRDLADREEAFQRDVVTRLESHQAA